MLTNERLRRQFDEDLEFGLGDDSYYGSAGGAYLTRARENGIRDKGKE